MTARDMLLSRIRAALSGDSVTKEEIDRDYRQETQATRAEITAEFAQRVAEYRATVARLPARELPAAIAAACSRHGVRTLVVPDDMPPEWLPEKTVVLRDGAQSEFSREQLDTTDGVLTGCLLAIAQTGTLVLDGGPLQGRRIISLLPDYHLCLVYEDQVVGLVAEAIARLGDVVRQSGRPITLISGPSATSDIELNRVEGVHGPRTLEVLLVSR
ncbi:MAG TPA: lactate utilization protein C [Chloroflexota bacterium]